MPRPSHGRIVRALLLAAAAALFAACREESTIEVKDLSFDGVKAVPVSRLKSVLATRESDWLPWGERRFFNRTQFEADLKRVEAFYADRGYPNARVTGFEIKLNDRQDQVRISVTIAEGDPVIVESVEFTGFEAVPEDHLASLKERAPLEAGAPFDRTLLAASREMAANELKDHGFPYATVHASQESLEEPPQKVRVTLRAEPGTRAYVGPVEITGNVSVSDNVIRRQLTFKPGELFKRNELQESQRKLYSLDLFEFANVEVVDPEQQSAEVPVRVTVTEGKHRRLNFGVGYGTEEKARVEAEWRHVNFLGGARTGGVHAKWSSLDRGVRLDFTQPYFFRPHFSFGAEAQGWFVHEPLYTLETYGGRETITHRANQRLAWSVSLVNERQRTTISKEALEDLSLHDELILLGLDPRTGRQEGSVVAVAFDLQRNTTDNLLNATTGYLASLRVEQAGRLLPGSYDYFAVNADGRHYWTIAKRFVVANRVQYGSIEPAGQSDANVPFSKRFFLGGSSSLRGWGRLEVSPLTDKGLPIGGFSMLAATSEVRFPLTRKLGAVVFVDAGSVGARPWDVKVGDLRYDAGPGLRYLTPIGPLRFDVGYQLNPIEGLLVNGKPQTRRLRFHFSIGQAF